MILIVISALERKYMIFSLVMPAIQIIYSKHGGKNTCLRPRSPSPFARGGLMMRAITWTSCHFIAIKEKLPRIFTRKWFLNIWNRFLGHTQPRSCKLRLWHSTLICTYWFDSNVSVTWPMPKDQGIQKFISVQNSRMFMATSYKLPGTETVNRPQ